jgi:hypothetical protein
MSINQEYIQLHDVNLDLLETGMNSYYPISVKDEMNTPSVNYLDSLTNTDIFLSKKNIHYMTYYLVSMNARNKTGVDSVKLALQVPKIMMKWSVNENLNEFEYAHSNILLTLEFLNKKFLGDHPTLYDMYNQLTKNIFRTTDKITIDACGNQASKKYNEMTATDYQNIDVWQSRQEYTYDKRKRYGNKIPMWQKSMNIRQYDRGNDGLHTSNPDRASLETQTRGYDMSNQIRGSNSYDTNPYYENI